MANNDNEHRSPVFRSMSSLTLNELATILETQEKLSSLPNIPVANVPYRLSLSSTDSEKWKFDGFRWKVSKTIHYPAQQPEFLKKYCICVNADNIYDSRCSKHVYISKQNPFDVVVCYIGDLQLATKLPHGNSKLNTAHSFQTTPASTIATIDTLVTRMSGAEAYKRLVATKSTNDSPRNVAQCHYRRRKYLEKQKITHDEIRNLLLLSYDLNTYFKLLQMQPELLVVLVHDQMKNEFIHLIQTTETTVPIFYDTTFSLADVFVSIICYRHTMFIEEPVVPLAVLFHETKHQHTHDRFIEILQREIPEIPKNSVLITDCEPALKNAFRRFYPNIEQFRCWNHFKQNLKRAAKKSSSIQQIGDFIDKDGSILPVTRREMKKRLIATIEDLLRLPTRIEFDEKYNTISSTWSEKFQQYFRSHVLPNIDELGGWTIRTHDLFSESSGVTTNSIESLNAVFKRWLAWKEISLDSLAQMFYLVNGFYVNEVKRGFCGIGGYHLKNAHANSKRSMSSLNLVCSFSPDEVVERMKDMMMQEGTSSVTGAASNDSVSESEIPSDPQGEDRSNVLLVQRDDDLDRSPDPLSSSSNNTPTSTEHGSYNNTTLAHVLNQQKLVHFDEVAKVYSVWSLDKEVAHCVHMNSKKSRYRCCCPSSVEDCSHVLAVKVHRGEEIGKKKNKPNLGHERKRKRIEDKVGKPGRKRPRRCDKENEQLSRYFTTHNNTSATLQPTTTSNSSSASPSISSTPRLSLQNISNVGPPSIVVDSIPRVIKSIRFMAPTNFLISPPNQNQMTVIQTSKPN